jgi:hypothetical protein
MLHPAFDLRYISAEEGLGVVATQFIPKGTMTSIETDLDMVLSPAQMEQLDRAHQELIKKFGYRKPTGEFFLDWDHARFVNHSFHNTEVFTTYEFGLAVRDVRFTSHWRFYISDCSTCFFYGFGNSFCCCQHRSQTKSKANAIEYMSDGSNRYNPVSS